jgi:hypothetical protein
MSREAEPPEDEEGEGGPEDAGPPDPSYRRCPVCGYARGHAPNCPNRKP